jgi:UDP-GlcNAc:undecaprenyl-phosphate/decaprenyl-phosphate GlcNAc-1-phosphate transferase
VADSADLLKYLLTFSLATFVAGAGTPLVAVLARRIGAICQPRADRWHREPTPLLGGIAVFAAIMTTALLLGPQDRQLAGLLIGTALIFGLGLLDDLRALPPQVKLAGQIASACVLLAAGIHVDLGASAPLFAIELALTLLWVIGITNAFNLLDNMDGLSAGIAGIAGLMLCFHNAAQGHVGLAIIGLTIAGAAAGFLIHNFHPATIFMGDCGSMTFGFALAGLALMGARGAASDLFLAVMVPIAILGLPIFDTTLVTIVRRLNGRPVTLGGRDHLSHRLVALGLSERGAVLVLYAISAALGTLGLVALYLGFWSALATGALAVVGVVLFGVFLSQVRVYGEPSTTAVESSFLGWQSERRIESWFGPDLAAMVLDLVLIVVSYLLAYLLKFEGNLSGVFLEQFAASLPFLIALKLVVLMASGAYRSMWRYFSTSDAFHLAVASLGGTIVSVIAVALALGFAPYSRSVFVIDWLLFTALLVGTRISFALLTDWFARLPRADSTRVLIVGADDRGELVLRSIQRDPAYRAVGFLDNTPSKQQRRMRGVPVLGSARDILSVAVATGAHEVIVATPLPAGLEHDRFVYLCHELGVECRDATMFLRQRLPDDQPALEASR